MSHIWCPACGWFGLRARRRNAEAADTALVLFHSQLAAQARARRRQQAAAKALLDEVNAAGVILAPWMRKLVEKHLAHIGDPYREPRKPLSGWASVPGALPISTPRRPR